MRSRVAGSAWGTTRAIEVRRNPKLWELRSERETMKSLDRSGDLRSHDLRVYHLASVIIGFEWSTGLCVIVVSDHCQVIVIEYTSDTLLNTVLRV